MLPDASRRPAAPTPLVGRVPAILPALVLLLALTACGTPAADPAADAPDATHSGTPGADPATVEPAAPGGLHPVLAAALQDGPRPPRGPADAATQLRVTTDAVSDLATPRRVLAAAAHQQQVTYRTLGRRPGWDGRVRAALPRRLHAEVADNVASRREFAALQGDYRSDELPAWRIVRPEPPARLLGHYRAAERRFGVGWEHLAAINLVETAMGRIVGYSVAGARGPMQFIPETWARYGRGDVDDPRDAITAAARYLRARGYTEPGGVAGALYAYNNSTRYVRGVDRIARVLQRNPRAYRGYWHWQVYYVSTAGDVLLPEGYAERRPLPVEEFLARG